MFRNLVSNVIIAFAVGTAGIAATPSHAQIPSGCSSSDQKLVSSYTQSAVDALVAGDLKRSLQLSQELDAKLSSACLAGFAQSQPARVKCSANEKQTTVDHYKAMMQSLLGGDAIRYLRLWRHLAESVSQPCWIALNYPQDAGVQRGCSSSELNLIASSAGPSIQASLRLLEKLDFTETIQLVQYLSARLSPGCQAALAEAQRKAQIQTPNTPRGSVNRPSGVLDHGGGTYSMPGFGACTPGGCLAY